MKIVFSFANEKLGTPFCWKMTSSSLHILYKSFSEEHSLRWNKQRKLPLNVAMPQQHSKRYRHAHSQYNDIIQPWLFVRLFYSEFWSGWSIEDGILLPFLSSVFGVIITFFTVILMSVFGKTSFMSQWHHYDMWRHHKSLVDFDILSRGQDCADFLSKEHEAVDHIMSDLFYNFRLHAIRHWKAKHHHPFHWWYVYK